MAGCEEKMERKEREMKDKNIERVTFVIVNK